MGMSTYAIGDVQGCFQTLSRLLDRIGFRRGRDVVWLAGDLVGRGPRSLELLRWANRNRDSVVAVLGNHDLRLLGLAEGVVSRAKDRTLLPVVDAADADELIAWLRGRPLLHRDGNKVLIHAGLLPDWRLEDAESWARRAEAVLRGPVEARRALLRSLKPKHRTNVAWGAVSEDGRLKLAINALTAMRVVDADGAPDLSHGGGLDAIAPGSRAWFDASPVVGPNLVICGHWSALGLHRREGLLALDSGCVHRRCLSAVRLEDGELAQEPYAD
jgi:bis(5'-nucleosyl)-tetraphosphatase (symmetrical)